MFVRIAHPRHPRAMTLLEVMIAMFIFLVGIVGVLAAIPSGIHSAEWVIFQDAAIHLAHSKFSEFRRDRADPNADLLMNGPYMNKHGTARPGGWRDFYYKSSGDALSFDNETYRYFDDIERYEWRFEASNQGVGAASSEQPSPPSGCLAPVSGSGSDVGLYKVTIIIRLKGTSREFRFTQYMVQYD